MKLYLLSRTDRIGHDHHDSVVVCASSKKDAIQIHPNGNNIKDHEQYYNTWTESLDNISCEEIGTANSKQKRGVILASFNAG